MLDLKLFMDLQGDTPASLLLKSSSPGYLQYFIISASVNYSVVVTGECMGELPNAAPISFDVLLSSVMPLLNKNHKFRLSYFNSTLKFESESGKFYIIPLCVEHVSEYTLSVARRYMEFSKMHTEYTKAASAVDEADRELAQLKENYRQTRVMELSGFVNASDPWGSREESKSSVAIDDYYLPKIREKEESIAELRDRCGKFRTINMGAFKRIATIAARAGSTISMCDTFAVVDLGTVFIVQKADCGSRSIQGKLLRRLLMVKDGSFHEYNNELVFVSTVGTSHERTDTVVFITPYLPNTSIDSSIVTRGAVRERYNVNIKGMFDVISVVSQKFETMVFDMGSSRLILSNDRGESLIYNFDVADAKTLELNKLLRGESAGEVVMSSIEIPRSVQRFLPLLENNFTIYVKDRKIILQSDTIYVIFGR